MLFCSADLALLGLSSQREMDQKLRLEMALRLRERFLQQQHSWEEFREAESTRRAEKAKRQELARYKEIVARSQARRHYTELMYEQTITVRSHTEAAVIIQSAWRRMKLARAAAEEKEQLEGELEMIIKERAARKIQRSWRRYHQHKVYIRRHYRKIRTSPVISVRNQLPGNQQRASYQKGTSITGSYIIIYIKFLFCYSFINFFRIPGNPRRKVHQTTESGFKVLRPTTRDLLLRRGTHQCDHTQQEASGSLDYMFSRKPSGSHGNKPPRLLSQGNGGKLLPELYVRKNQKTAGHPKNNTELHLPDIIRSS